jgi:amidohydrolase
LDGPMMAAFGVFEIKISGRGCHAAMPHQGTDALLASAQLVLALQSVVSRNIDPLDSAVVSVTQVHAGDTWNVIPEQSIIRGTARWFKKSVGDVVETRIKGLASAIADAFRCEAHIDYERRLPSTVNNSWAAGFLRDTIRIAVPALEVRDCAPSMGSEDFGFMLEAVPGCYAWLGTGTSGRPQTLHSPRFDFNDEVMPHGVALWVALVRRSLERSIA